MATEQPKETPHNYPSHLEDFEVVMLKKGVSELTAGEDDFLRVPVQADQPIAALMKDEVQNHKTHRPLFAARPGVMTDPEIMARRRTMEGPPVDRSRL